MAKDLEPSLRKIWLALKKAGVIRELNLRTRRPLRDVAEIEQLVALRADTVIATSAVVRQDLLEVGVASENIEVVPNAIEDYWFNRPPLLQAERPALVFLGRIGGDVFTLKLKGLDRLIDYYRRFPAIPKHTIGITTNKELVKWCDREIPNHTFHPNLRKEKIPNLLSSLAGGILLITSRYEGFSLSLIEGMSQGLIPVTYPVGIAPEIIENGRNGFLVHSQSEGRKAIEHLLQMSNESRMALAMAAQETAQRFTSKAISTRLIEVYAHTLKKGNKHVQ